ncbi:hypothetical protein Hanom_Chr12g01129281 [Helianthus anomalus]
MKIKRWVRCRRISEILKVFDAADALLSLSGLPIGVDAGNRGAREVSLSEKDLTPSRLSDDNNEGVTRLSAYIVT